MRGFLAQEPKLAPYRMYLEETLRRRPHTLGAGEERVAAEAGELERAGGDVHGVLSNADLPYPTIKLSTGVSVRLDAPRTPCTARRGSAPIARRFRRVFGALKVYDARWGRRWRRR